ncbi:hypothetical protein LZC95_04745 [Pendulispora brunnea]|uniref:DUF3592 domain-containing protein n=1 Tax=Pendulispora brunnea TaxID=2905690 RepID=A0ABZ2KGT9_9BACT
MDPFITIGPPASYRGELGQWYYAMLNEFLGRPAEVPHPARDANVERQERSLARWRLIFLALALALPAGCYGVFERQAKRLDALGDHGEPATATVTAVRQKGTVDYSYVVGGATYTWNVSQEDAPPVVGKTFPITYLPEDPALSRPGADRVRATREAASNRRFAWKLEAGIFGFLAFNAVLCDVRLRRLRKTRRTELTDPRAYRTRLILTGAMLAPFLVLIFAWHLSDSLRRGDSVWPVVLGTVGVFGILGGTGFYILREGLAQAGTRSTRLLKWVGPIAVGLAVLRALAGLIAPQ